MGTAVLVGVGGVPVAVGVGVVATQPGNLNLPTRVCHVAAAGRRIVLVVYQNVQSSDGSMDMLL